MDKAVVGDDAEEGHVPSRATDDGDITIEPHMKAAPEPDNAKLPCNGCCCCTRAAPNFDVTVDPTITLKGGDSQEENTPPKVKIMMGTCGDHLKKGRNLIICIDGMANQFGNQNTNVIELYNLLLKGSDDEQLTWYNSGIGTYAELHWRSPRYWLQVIFHKIDLAIAWNFEKTLLGAYGWLAENYRDRDCIYLFGFSRGAFQVRALSAMIDQVGLIYKGNEMQIPLDEPQRVQKVGTSEHVSKTERFKKAFSHEVKVHFIGACNVRDTVSSIGIARGKHVLPGTTKGMQHVCYFRHALALDERRVKFLPEYAWGGSPVDRRKKDESAKQENPSRQLETKDTEPPHIVEAWFPGTHSDIGGGNRQNKGMDRNFTRELLPKEHVEIKESLTGVWHLFELLPFKRQTYTVQLEGRYVRVLSRRPHCWASRKIHPGQKIHAAILVNETRDTYLPQARLALAGPWWLIEDLLSSARVVVQRFVKGDDVKSLIEQINGFENGSQAIIRAFIEALGEDSHQGLDQGLNQSATRSSSIWQISDNKFFLLDRALQSHSSCGDIAVPKAVIKCFVGSWLTGGTEEHKRVAQRFLQLYTNSMCILQLEGHTDTVPSVSFTQDCNHVVSGSWDWTIRIWDALTGQEVGEPLRGHKSYIRSVAVSFDGQRVVAGSHDGMVRIWDMQKRQEVVAPSLLRGSTAILSVAISPDGSQIVAGFWDGTIQVWDARTGAPAILSLKGHAHWVQSVAISHDGNRIVLGSHDCTICVWNIWSGMEVVKMTGHTSWVLSIAVSPDGSKIVSGSRDRTLHIWDAKSGQQVGEPLFGHTN
ncbi:hypothetical protein FA15DRAFT_741070 [Coprinopsis marcescibilis]|uniref:T6SS Phospholipase effector Tle1-like catalytic domain-containing protein n=1 Tax=Coprinopsis marcescibilis TaxID=230819 RepID=A0A5C3L8H1_COPMA|nr:hypothetical protein FA15DRAFT_741070 [Coprinopsis marcescibilis]